MRFARLFTILCGILFASQANSWCNPCEGRFYLKGSTGASFSNRAHIKAPIGFWDTSQQGYNSRLGTRPILGAGLGYEMTPLFAADMTLSYRPQYQYRKFQIPVPNILTPAFLGSKTREFDLDIATLMLNFYLTGRGIDYLCWSPSCLQGCLYPILSGGIGVSRVNIYNFRAKGLSPAGVDPFPAFGSENQYTVRYQFTYQLAAGLEYRQNDCWAVSAGYRWFEVNRFKGPTYLRDPTGIALDIAQFPMKIKFAAQELFLEFKLFL